MRGVIDRIAKVLGKRIIGSIFKPLETIRHKMKFVKDNINQNQRKGVYKINSSCGKIYIGETGRSFKTRIKEHCVDIKKKRSHTSALVEHSLLTKHQIYLEDTTIIAKEDHYFKRRFKEALEILRHPNNLNQDGGLEVLGSLYSLSSDCLGPYHFTLISKANLLT